MDYITMKTIETDLKNRKKERIKLKIRLDFLLGLKLTQ